MSLSKSFNFKQNTQDYQLLNFKDLCVKQYKIQNSDGTVLFYEEAQTDMSYEFNFGGLSTLMYVFDDSRKYEEVYTRGNLKFVQIQLKDTSYVNVIIEDNSTQIYTFVYGFSNEEFLKRAEEVKLEGTKLVAPKFKAVTFNSSSNSATSWNDLLVFFTPLIMPLRELSGF
ncbi:MAG: hypothetical protein J7J96_08745 [Sulfurimonas sp.]|nr:hypothetical protein [Sulfurimonas sp.]